MSFGVLTPLVGALRRRQDRDQAAAAIYAGLVVAARQPALYLQGGVADTEDGRFEMLALHVGLMLRRLYVGGPAARPLARALLAAFHADLDQSLRELGVGDLRVGKKVRAMSEALFGRLKAYDAALADADDAPLATALARNALGTDAPSAGAKLAHYVRAFAAALAAMTQDQLAAGEWPAPALPPSMRE